jgi:dephospho-CoA kinase
MPLRIGLTGGIGSGKSTVAGMLARRGARIIDTDAIAHRLTGANGAAMPALRLAFGDAIAAPDGALDREMMRTLVFADPDARRRLEALLHPLIGAEAQREAGAATSGVVVFDVPLLAESPRWRRRVARVLVVDCTHETQVERIVRRSEAARAARRAIADAVIFNDGIDLEALDAAVDAVWRLWQLTPQDPVEQ